MVYTNLTIGDRFGWPLGELSVEILYCTWRISNIGKMEFIISSKDELVNDKILRFGNLVLARFENGLPNWAGVIDPPRTWENGQIKLTAYSGEYLFDQRTTGKIRKFTGNTVADIYRILIDESNGLDNTGIVIGNITDDNKTHVTEYNFKNLLTIFQQSLTNRLSTCEFDVTGHFESSKIILKANFYVKKGVDKSQLALVEGKNLMPVKLVEQGPIINEWNLAGEGFGFDIDRITSSKNDSGSIGSYGLRQDSKIFSDVSIQETLDNHANNLLEDSRQPKCIFDIKAIDGDPAFFADYHVGDLISITSHSVGFDGTNTTVRILAREYKPMDGICDLVVQEV